MKRKRAKTVLELAEKVARVQRRCVVAQVALAVESERAKSARTTMPKALAQAVYEYGCAVGLSKFYERKLRRALPEGARALAQAAAH